ncbi:MAG: UDP-2-acetamido-3-amino-2,3-dideoxy-D-glucuronate N-acetyltransferase [Deltaproteobacteria bacterium ADurb.Bin151]|nr:MAG: UDP-2-acetamido-3-amino-2,3-dideoxy-D-glucuronate N-acetyltransferase [Deltaproteobacteria bacterium ADurb.Bin151]
MTPNSSPFSPDALPLTPPPDVAVIGSGYWGKNLVRNFYQLGVLNTICDGTKSVREEMNKTYPDIPVTGDVDGILKNKDIQCVVIAAPAVHHFSLAEKALKAGKHVFVEKPLSLNYTEGEKLVRLAAEQNRILFVGHVLNYHAAVIRLKEMIRTGKIGRLQYIYSRRLSLGKIRREENILWSFAPHDISIILSLTGEEPSYVDSVGSNFLHAHIADVTMTNLKFPSGIGGHIFVSWLNPYKEQKLVVVGSSGMLVFDDTEPVETKLVLYPHTINWQNGLPVPNKAQSVPIDIKDIWEEPLKAECKAFLAAVETNTRPLTSGEEGLKVLKVLEISQRSLEQKESVTYHTLPTTPDPVSAVMHPLPASRSYFAHESVVIDKGCEIGSGTKIWHYSHILSRSRIGANCNIGQNVVIGPDAAIGNKCKIQNNVSVYKGVTLEDGVFCGPSMVFTNVYNPRAEIGKMDQVRPTLVKKGATLGANCTIVCGRTIGSYAFIGAGAVVTKDVVDHALMAGNPARQIGWACKCGERVDESTMTCPLCRKKYKLGNAGLIEE